MLIEHVFQRDHDALDVILAATSDVVAHLPQINIVKSSIDLAQNNKDSSTLDQVSTHMCQFCPGLTFIHYKKRGGVE